mmetsp:Transcript_11421/g.37789  ORF Transcript_11421/g.37789 Transcript_11421/m.37789 type:complete len:236 (+) Transcript_11421:289-996(+)
MFLLSNPSESASQCLSLNEFLISEKSNDPALQSSGWSSFKFKNEFTMAGRSSISRITISAPRPFKLLVPSSNSNAWVSSRSLATCDPPTYPTIKPMFAFAADPTPDTESSTAMHESTLMPSAAAAFRYTSGSGLYFGGSKSLCPEWILSSGKNSCKRAVSMQTGTRGFGDVVETQYLNPEIFRKFKAFTTPSFGFASARSATRISSFCFSSNVAWFSLHISRGSKPSPALLALTT